MISGATASAGSSFFYPDPEAVDLRAGRDSGGTSDVRMESKLAITRACPSCRVGKNAFSYDDWRTQSTVIGEDSILPPISHDSDHGATFSSGLRWLEANGSVSGCLSLSEARNRSTVYLPGQSSDTSVVQATLLDAFWFPLAGPERSRYLVECSVEASQVHDDRMAEAVLPVVSPAVFYPVNGSNLIDVAPYGAIAPMGAMLALEVACRS